MNKTIGSRPILAYIARQRDQIREGGWPALRRKLGVALRALVHFPLWLVELPLAVLIVLVVRALRPFHVVRFGEINGWRIGPLAQNVELYLCERDAGINVPKTGFTDFWYYLYPPCNSQLDRMWRRVLHIVPAALLKPGAALNALIPGGDVHWIRDNTWKDRDVHNLIDRIPAHLAFLPKEEERGQAGLRALGIPPGAPFVCLMVRDSSYLDKTMPWRPWNYHNHRDCNVQNYILAAQELVRRGYFVVRMGAVVKETFNLVHPMVIDYATNGSRNEFMDVYLGAKCAFCISNSTGYDAVPFIFRRPIVFVDHVPLGLFTTYSSRFLATTKKHWLRDQARLMTFRELFESGAAHFSRANQFEAAGIDLIESTPAEIAAVVLEMESRLKGTWQGTEEDEALQHRFWQIFPKSKSHGEFRSRAGTEFLRMNRELLD